jgi:hypothetical protein
MSDDIANQVQRPPDNFEAVLATELAIIRKQRRASANAASDDDIKLAGLAFSGGGIRSATFNLGFIQGLANGKVLHLFDYLSTVSGGGYIGGWLSALWHRSLDSPPGEEQVRNGQQALATPPNKAARDGSSGFPRPEAQAVRFVRRYSNYLTPRLGLSGDTLALVASALRNFVVMQLLLISLLVSIFALLLWLIGVEKGMPPTAPYDEPAWLVWLFGLATVDLSEPGRWLMPPAMGFAFAALGLSLYSQHAKRERHDEPRVFGPNSWIILALLAAMTSGISIAEGIRLAWQHLRPTEGGMWVLVPAAAYCLAWSGTLLQRRRKSLRALAGMAGGATVFALALHLCMGPFATTIAQAPGGHALALAPLAAIAAYCLVITVHLGVAGSALSEWQREWWARAGGLGLSFSLAWALGWAFLLFAPPLIQAGAKWSIAGGGLWTALTWLGAHLASGKDTNGEKGISWKEIAAKVAPWLFLIGLLGLMAWAFVSVLLTARNGSPSWPAENIDAYLASLATIESDLAGVIALAAGILFAVLVVFVDLNLFSAHSFYRNRLARAFLGASRIEKRRPNAFTGFDRDDDLALAALAGQRPIHLFNANLNITGGSELAWQTRRGASFSFTPNYCGYSGQTSLGDPIGGYRPSESYGGGLTVATAVAACGAAASPNMGFHTASSVATLLTVFNIRLARWCPNPERAQWTLKEPRIWSAGPLFAELSGNTDWKGRWLNISDGGHFENLGIYELIRRRAALIVVTDISGDRDYQFDDLAITIRKISVDFGVKVEFSAQALDDIRPQGDKGGPRFSKKTWAVGRIRYPDRDWQGYLIYVKSALPKDAPIDIRQYRDAHTDFPHESTADQWFDEDQFEAYRHLGQIVAEDLCRTFLQGDFDTPAAERIEQVRDKVLDVLSTPKAGASPGVASAV